MCGPSSTMKGSTLRILSVSDPSLGRKRLIVNVTLLDLFLLNGLLLYVGLYLLPEMLYACLALIPFVTGMAVLQHLFIKSVLLRSGYPVTIYANGIQFPSFSFDRWFKRPSYVAKDDIASAWVSGFYHPGRLEEMEGHLILNLRTNNGKLRDTGARRTEDLEPVMEIMEKQWGIKVERRYSADRSAAPIVPITPSKEPMKYCAQCGKASGLDINFCPHCGRMFDAPPVETAPVQTPNPYQTYLEEPKRAPQGPPVAPPWSERTAGGKSLETAFYLALIVGFLGIMGVGHLYLGKVARGLVFLVVGGFFALLSFASWISSLGMTEYSVGVRVFTALIISIPYLMLQVIQVKDVRRPPKRGPGIY